MTCFDESMLALPWYEARHVAFARRIDDWCQRHGDLWKGAASDAEQAGDRIRRALGQDGWLGFLGPGAGSDADGGDMRSVCLAREALAYADDLADFAFSIQALSATPLLRYGSPEQRQRYLPAMAAGTLSGAFAVSEEEAGSDVTAIRTRAEKTSGGYVLTGVKAWIANGGTADLYCVIARTGADGPLGLTAFLVPASTPGLRPRPTPVLAPRAFATIELDACRVPHDAVLGRPGAGYAITLDLLTRYRMTVGAAALGFARRAAGAALHRARTRRMHGGCLFDLPTVKATLAELEVKLQAAALLVARAAWEADRGNPRYGRYSSVAKLYATESAQEIVDAALQVFGAAGLVSDSVTERLYRQIRSLRIYEGPSEVQKMIIASALGAPKLH